MDRSVGSDVGSAAQLDVDLVDFEENLQGKTVSTPSSISPSPSCFIPPRVDQNTRVLKNKPESGELGTDSRRLHRLSLRGARWRKRLRRRRRRARQQRRGGGKKARRGCATAYFRVYENADPT